MESHKFPPINDALVHKSKKKKPSALSPDDSAKKSGASTRKGQKPTKRSPVNDVSPSFQQEKLTPDSQPDSSIGNEYRTLRRKYLLLEEESFGLGRELQEVEDEVKALEDEKMSLLDELVVLEGLVDPSKIRPQGQKLP